MEYDQHHEQDTINEILPGAEAAVLVTSYRTAQIFQGGDTYAPTLLNTINNLNLPVRSFSMGFTSSQDESALDLALMRANRFETFYLFFSDNTCQEVNWNEGEQTFILKDNADQTKQRRRLKRVDKNPVINHPIASLYGKKLVTKIIVKTSDFKKETIEAMQDSLVILEHSPALAEADIQLQSERNKQRRNKKARRKLFLNGSLTVAGLVTGGYVLNELNKLVFVEPTFDYERNKRLLLAEDVYTRVYSSPEVQANLLPDILGRNAPETVNIFQQMKEYIFNNVGTPFEALYLNLYKMLESSAEGTLDSGKAHLFLYPFLIDQVTYICLTSEIISPAQNTYNGKIFSYLNQLIPKLQAIDFQRTPLQKLQAFCYFVDETFYSQNGLSKDQASLLTQFHLAAILSEMKILNENVNIEYSNIRISLKQILQSYDAQSDTLKYTILQRMIQTNLVNAAERILNNDPQAYFLQDIRNIQQIIR